jgi:hypothetical protein
LLSAVAATLVLFLDPSQVPTAAAQPQWVPQSTSIQLTGSDAPAPQLRSKFWSGMGAAGMGLTFAGGAGILTEYSTRGYSGRNIHPPLYAMGAAFLAGALPGWILGEGARREENEKGRGAVGILDLVGIAAVLYSFTQIYRPIN